jgi:cytochrome P450
MKMSDSTSNTMVFDPMSPQAVSDPYAFYAGFRNSEPVFKTPMGAWFITRHEDVALVVRDHRFCRDNSRVQAMYHGPDWQDEYSLSVLAKMILFLDPPDHTRIRGQMASAFTAKRITHMRSSILSVTDGLLKSVLPKLEMDVVRNFALPLPVMVICGMLGVPEADRSHFIESFRLTSRLVEAVPMSRSELDVANQQMEFLVGYFSRLIESRRRARADDLITSLIAAEEAGSKLSNDELAANLILLFLAGYETTTNLVANATLVLLSNPTELEKLRASPELMPKAVDELLRYESPVQLTARTVLEDVEVGGKLLRRGDLVLACLGAANRDPEVYDHPDKFDISRPVKKHLSFGGGVHFCLGAQLSRLEMECALHALLKLPELRLLEEKQHWQNSFVWRGLSKLQVGWSAH